MIDDKIYGGIEAGGTKFICGVGTNSDDIKTTRVRTGEPEKTMKQIIEFFAKQPKIPSAIGLGCFGPIDIDPDSEGYGEIINSAKASWNGFNPKRVLEQSLGVVVNLDTDVNVAALGEHIYGSAQGYDDFAYITVGTGIGGGIMSNGKLIRGLMHTEVGHMQIPRSKNDDFYDGCPRHDNCLEGLASGRAMGLRWGESIDLLAKNEVAWELEAEYLAYGVVNLITTVSPKRIIIGGGVMSHDGLIESVRVRVQEILNGYINRKEIVEDIGSYIVTPGLAKLSGVVGAMILASNS